MNKLTRNRMELLYETARNRRGILSTSLAPSGNHDYSKLHERLDCLMESGLDQLLEIMADPTTFTGTDIAMAETRLVLEGTKHGAYREMFFDTAAQIRNKYPDLPLIASCGIMNIMSYGQKRFLNKCVEYQVDAVDFPRYLVLDDPIHFRADVRSAGMYIICPVYLDRFDLKNEEQMKLLEQVVRVSEGQLFVVPGASGSTNKFEGVQYRPLIDNIREMQARNGVQATIICIGGLTTPENAYQMVQVAGADGIHYSSAFINRAMSGVPLEQISDWLRETKQAMGG